ncbi:unnamed protein product [Heterobilharzia americana]|nr:unnamed protein product [Heterobilharzia americana]
MSCGFRDAEYIFRNIPDKGIFSTQLHDSKHFGVNTTSSAMKSEKERRYAAESYCQMLLHELESREFYLQELKNTLFKRIEEAEYQMNKLICLRNEETEEAQKASKMLRSSIARLKERFQIEKSELENKICSIQDTYEGRITELNNVLQQSEKTRDSLFSKLKTSEFTIQDLNKEIANSRKELSDSMNRIAHLQQVNCDLSNELAKYKLTAQKASSRAENLANQYNELRCKTEQANRNSVQNEKAVRVASERRSSAENALAAAHQRADNLSMRNTQLERDLATIKVRVEEQTKSNEVAMAKLKRRLMAIHSEASKWKRSYQEQKNIRDLDLQKSNEVIQTMLDERQYLQSELTSAKNNIKENVLTIEHLKRQAALDASNASTRLLAALTTGEEGVATALELKQCIESQLQPELESIRSQCKSLESELMKSNVRCEQLQENLTKAYETIEQTKLTETKQRDNFDNELNLLREQIREAKEQISIKSKLLEKAENQAEQYKSELNNLFISMDNKRASTEYELKNLTKQLDELKSVHDNVQKQLHNNQRTISKLKLARDTALNGLGKIQVELKDTRDKYEKQLKQKSEEIVYIHQKLKQAEVKSQEANIKYENLLEESNNQLSLNQNIVKQLENTMNDQNIQITKFKEMELKITELKNSLTESEIRLQSAHNSQELNEQRYNELENRFHQLQLQLNERENLLKVLENEIQTKTCLHNEKCVEYEVLKTQFDKQISSAMKTVEFSTGQQKEIEIQKLKIEEQKNQLQQELLEVQRMNRQLQSDIRNLENNLIEQNCSQTKSISECNEFKYQLKTITEQFNTQSKELDDVKQNIELLNKEKQSLLQQVEQEKQKYAQLENEFFKESNSYKELNRTLTSQVSELNTKLYNTEKLLHETEYRLVQADQKMKLACQESKRLAIKAATAKTFSQLTDCSLCPDEVSDKISDSLIHQDRSCDLVVDEVVDDKTVIQGHNNSNTTFKLFPENKKFPTSCPNDHKIPNSKRLSVSFAPIPFIETSENIRRPVGISLDPAGDLEVLIRQVTDTLDRQENGCTLLS